MSGCGGKRALEVTHWMESHVSPLSLARIAMVKYVLQSGESADRVSFVKRTRRSRKDRARRRAADEDEM